MAGASRSRSPRTARPPLREDGSWDPEAGVIYVWFDALINYITGAGFPDDHGAFERWWPADLHVIGKDIARFHTIFWPAMLWSAGLEAPRRVWVHGWLLAAGGERMSKSRGNFLDPNDFVAAFGADGARYVVLREVPFDRDAEVSWDSFVRRYNADLANDFGNLVNRTVSMTNRYLDGERPAPAPAAESPLAEGWADTHPAVRRAARGLPAPRRARELWEFVGGANKFVDAEKPWELAKAAKDGDEAAAARLRAVLGDLVEACRLVGLAAAPYMPAIAPQVLGQLGYGFDYERTATAARRSSTSSRGAPGQGSPVVSGRPEPLFPRLESEAAVEALDSRVIGPTAHGRLPRRPATVTGNAGPGCRRHDEKVTGRP